MLWGLLQSTHTTKMKSISQSTTDLWANIGFGHILQSVGHLESNLDQKLISFSSPIRDSTCKTKLKYLYQFLRYFGNRQTNKQTDRHRQKHYLRPERRAITIHVVSTVLLHNLFYTSKSPTFLKPKDKFPADKVFL